MKYRIFAPSRSGHHAFINWLAGQLDEPTIHFNNCVLGWAEQKLKANTGKTTEYGDKPYEHQIYSIEYFDLEDYDKFDFGNWDDEYIDIVFLRDFYNWMASSLKNGENRFNTKWKNTHGKKNKPVIELWQQYAQEFINKDIIPNALFVSYNEWCNSKEYREGLAKKLGLVFTDKGIDNVPKYGGGSSYDRMNHQGKGSQLQTSTRWKKHINDSQYVNMIVNNPKCVELNEEVFNMKLVDTNPLVIE